MNMNRKSEGLFIRAWRNRYAIADGIKNNLFKKEHVEEVYNHRLGICSKCPSIDTDGEKCAIPGTAPCCGECGCSLGIKLRSLSAECDLKKWEAETTEEEEDAINAKLNENE
jgi:hypothetical protein